MSHNFLAGYRRSGREIRNSKSETNPKFETKKTPRNDNGHLEFWIFGLWNLFRISDLEASNLNRVVSHRFKLSSPPRGRGLGEGASGTMLPWRLAKQLLIPAERSRDRILFLFGYVPQPFANMLLDSIELFLDPTAQLVHLAELAQRTHTLDLPQHRGDGLHAASR